MFNEKSFLPGQEKNPEEKKRVTLMTGTQMERSLRHLAGLIEKYEKENYEVDILNLGTMAGVYEQKDGGYPEELEKEIMAFLSEKKPEMIGVSMIDFGVDRISDLIEKISKNEEIQKNKTKIIVGGPYAIEHSEKCLDIKGVDAICYSSAWHFADIVEACANDNLKNIPGLMIKTGVNEQGKAEYIKTPVPNLMINMTGRPLPAESLKNSYMIYKGHLVNTAESGGAIPVEHHQLPHKHTGVLVLSEGCVNNCKFCSIPTQYNETAKRVDESLEAKKAAGQSEAELSADPNADFRRAGRVHALAPEEAINLIQNYLKENPNTEYLLFNDNDFTARSPKEIREFGKLYKEQVGLPFYCQCSPNTATKQKIDLLREAGMDTFDTGVQGSKQSNEAAGYDRICTDEQVLKIAENLSPYLEKRNEKGEVIEEGSKAAFDFINGNKIHTKDDMLSTMDFVKKITNTIESKTEGQGSWNLAIHNLTLDVDRELAREYEKRIAAVEGISVGEVDDSDYHNATVEAFYKLNEPYLNIMLEWMGGLHDQVHLGRLPRQSEAFAKLIEEVLAKDEKLSELIASKKGSKPETIDMLTDEDVYAYLGDKENPRAKEVLKLISEKMPEINYSYHRPDRYDFDYDWAEKQIAEK